MKRVDARSAYADYSGKLSELIAKLDFAGIGIIWVLRLGKANGVVTFGNCLLLALGLLTLSLTFALLHYAYASCAWGLFNRLKERQDTREDGTFGAPRWINWPTNVFFWGKSLLCVIAYGVIVAHIGNQLI